MCLRVGGEGKGGSTQLKLWHFSGSLIYKLLTTGEQIFIVLQFIKEKISCLK